MRGLIPKTPNFSSLRSQNEPTNVRSPIELIIPPPNAPTSALQQVSPSTSTTNTDKRSPSRNRRSPFYYGIEDMSSDSVISAPPKRHRRAGDIESFQPSNISVAETGQSISEQAAEDTKISPVIGIVSPSDLRVRYLTDYRRPTPEDDTNSMTAYEAEVNETSE